MIEWRVGDSSVIMRRTFEAFSAGPDRYCELTAFKLGLSLANHTAFESVRVMSCLLYHDGKAMSLASLCCSPK